MITSTPPEENPDSGLPIDAILKGMMNRRRRRILFHLRQNGSATLAELVEMVEEDTSDEGVDNPRLKLWHQDLPKLEDIGLIAFDKDEEIVELSANPEELGEWLDMAVRKDIRVQMASKRAKRDDIEHNETKILVVDDDRGITDVVETYLESNYDSLSVKTATNIEDASTHLRENPIDCIVSDLKMPGTSGLDFLKSVRKEDPEIPFLLFTGEGNEAVAGEAVNNDVTGYVLKSDDPNQFDDLAQQIRTAVSPA